MGLIKGSILTNIKAYDKRFNALLVNVSVSPWTVTDTSSTAAHGLLSALFFLSKRHRTRAQRLEQGLL
jgi:hypothetical protein